ncbi:hypothetical protein HY632_01625 [Candidatus Uhrbacteria bacterium]|nr:hypothetical protein [Candidatus Uhrbacteria bacterium]
MPKRPSSPSELMPEAHVDESKHAELLERGAQLRAEIATLQSTIAALETVSIDTGAGAIAWTPDQHRAREERVAAATAELTERIAAMETARATLLADWERVAMETLGAHVHLSVPDATELISSVRDPLAQLDAAVQLRHQQLAQASVLKRSLSSAHRRATAQAQAHVHLMGRIQSAHIATANSTTGISEAQRTMRARVESLREAWAEQAQTEVRTRWSSLVEHERPLAELTRDAAFAERIDARIDAEEIVPLLARARGAEPTPERDALLAEWGTALRSLQTHALNDHVDPDQWTGPTYSAQEERARERVTASYPKDPRASWRFAHAADEHVANELERARALLSVSYNDDPREQTNDLVRAFSSWRMRAAFTDTVEPWDRPESRYAVEDARRRMAEVTVSWWDQPDALLKHLQGVRRWRFVRSDPAFAAQATPAECDAFADTLVDTLIEKVIRPGGHESWAGTDAVRRIHELRNVHALPRLLEHLFVSGSGHTNAIVCGVMEELARTPEGRTAIAGYPPVMRRLFEQLNDPTSILQEGAGNDSYTKTWLLSRGEIFLAQSALASFFPTSVAEPVRVNKRIQFLNGLLPESEILATLRAHRDAVERAMLAMDDVAPWWAIPGLTTFIAERPEFLAEIAARIPGTSVAQQQKFVQLTHHRKVAESAAVRGALLQGVLALRASGAAGVEMFQGLLDRYQGAKDDPARARRIFRYAELLHRFEVLAADYDPAQRLEEIDGELATHDGELAPLRAQRDALRKRRRLLGEEHERCTEGNQEGYLTPRIQEVASEIDGVDTALNELRERMEVPEERVRTLRGERQLHARHGLAGMAEHYQQRVAGLLEQRLGIAPAAGAQLAANLETHLESGLVDIATTLLLSYQAKHAERPQQVLRTVVEHIVVGDFLTWRYQHEHAQAQLAGLDAERVPQWIANLPSTEVAPDAEEHHASARTVAARLLADARQHAREELMAQPSGPTREESIEPADAEQYVREVHEKFQGLEALLRNDAVDLSHVQSALAEMQVFCRSRGLAQVAADLEQVLRPFSAPEIGTVRAEEFDDPLRLLKIGTEPTETCQSWKRGSYNECLLSYVADANVKGMNVVTEHGETILRCVARLLPTSAPDAPATRMALVLEPPYTLSDEPRVYRALARLACAKAAPLGVVLQLGERWPEEARARMIAEAAACGMQIQESVQRMVHIPPSHNGVLYSDSFGGRMEPRGNAMGPHAMTEIAAPAGSA